jgi:CheY-like chemotaxis protein
METALVSPVGGCPRRILLVEDDDATRIGYEELLQVQGFTVDAVATGAEALGVVSRMAPDVIITDVRLPDTDGLSLASELRQQPDMAAIPIIGITAHWTAESRARARAAGVSAFLLKPSAPAHFIAEIHRVLAHRPEDAA